MFRARGVQALFELELGVRRTGAGGPLLQLPFVVLEVIVDAIEQRLGDTVFAVAPTAEDFLGKFVAAETLAQDETGLTHDEFEQVQFFLEDVEQLLLK